MRRKVSEYHIIIERDEDGLYVGDVPELPGCHTQAKSLDLLIKRIREAIAAYRESNQTKRRMEFIGVQRVSL